MSKITIIIRPKIDTYEERGWSPVIHEEKHIWITKDGRQIPINELTNEHIQNAIRYLYRNKRTSFDVFNLLVKEINRRGIIYFTRDEAVYFK